MFFYLHGQDISRAGVKLLPPGEGPEGEFWKQDGQSMRDEPKEQGKENLWSFNLLSISISIREAAMFCLTCIGQIFATLSLFITLEVRRRLKKNIVKFFCLTLSSSEFVKEKFDQINKLVEKQ